MERLSSKKTLSSKEAGGATGSGKAGTCKTVKTGIGATHCMASRFRCWRIGCAESELTVVPCRVLRWKVRVARLMLRPQIARTIISTRQCEHRRATISSFAHNDIRHPWLDYINLMVPRSTIAGLDAIWPPPNVPRLIAEHEQTKLSDRMR